MSRKVQGQINMDGRKVKLGKEGFRAGMPLQKKIEGKKSEGMKEVEKYAKSFVPQNIHMNMI